MVCTEVQDTDQNSLSHWKTWIWLPWLSKNSKHTH